MRRCALCWITLLVVAGPASAQLTVAAPRLGNPLLPSRTLGVLNAQTEATDEALPEAGSSSNTRYVLPVLLSAVVPGMGEIVTGHWWRGIPFVAADIATWFFYAHFQSEGRDWRTNYEAYADIHWLYTGDVNGNGFIDVDEVPGWQENLKEYYDGQYGDNYNYWDTTQPYNCTCPYIPKEEDAQHYYENIGKYLYYYPGWDDWAWNGDPATSDSQGHRAEYVGMRQKSNDNFDHGTSMIYFAMATRLASMTQTVFLMRKETQNLEVRPIRTSGRGAGLEIAYRY